MIGTCRTFLCRSSSCGSIAISEVQDSVCELPHARDFLAFCRSRSLRTFLLSTIHGDHFAVQAAVTGFGRYLDRAYVDMRDKREKIHEILEENDLEPTATLFVGDMQHDIKTAKHVEFIRAPC